MRRAAAWTAIVASAPRVGYVPNAADVRPSDEVEKHDRKRDLEASRTHLLDRNATGPFGEVGVFEANDPMVAEQSGAIT